MQLKPLMAFKKRYWFNVKIIAVLYSESRIILVADLYYIANDKALLMCINE
jgi:hypothetical protein